MEKSNVVGKTLSATGDYKDIKGPLDEIVSFIKRHPELHDQFEAAFLEILENPRKRSLLVVTYCMNELRFPKVLTQAQSRLNKSKFRSDMHARHVVEAYSDDWPVKSLFYTK